MLCIVPSGVGGKLSLVSQAQKPRQEEHQPGELGKAYAETLIRIASDEYAFKMYQKIRPFIGLLGCLLPVDAFHPLRTYERKTGRYGFRRQPNWLVTVMSPRRTKGIGLPKAYENDCLADATRDDLLRALEECGEQLRRAEELLLRNQQCNMPKRKHGVHPHRD